jgi:branched-chain amino acid transport system substrate-binding protein
MKKNIFFVLLCLVVSVSLTPLSWGSEVSKPYKIGVSVNLTGVNADFALSCKAGAEVAAEQINAHGGILGRPVKLIIRDDKLDPDQGVRLLKELIFSEKIDAFLLSPPNVCQIPQLRLCRERGLLAFAQQGQVMEMLNDLMYPYYFIVGPTAYQEAFGLAKYVAAWKEIKSFVTFAPDYSWGHENAEAFTAKVKELRPGIKCVGHFYPPLEELEFGSYITGMLGKKADLVVTWIFGTTFISFAKQAASYGLLDRMQMLSWVHHDEIAEAGKDIPSGITVEADNEFWTNRKNKNPYYLEFEKLYAPKRGRLPALGGCQHYDMVMTLMQGIRKADSFDKDKIARAIEGSTFMTLRGPAFMRPINHCFDNGVYFGTTKYDEKLGYCDVVNVAEIAGPELMRPDEVYIRYRKDKKIDFRPWHENWYKDLPWAE